MAAAGVAWGRPLHFVISGRRNRVVACSSASSAIPQAAEAPAIRKCASFLQGIQSSEEWRAVPDLWRSSAEKFGDRVALVDPHRDPASRMTYKQVEQAILDFAEAMRCLGILPDQCVALFADNSCRWLIADQGIMAMGAANAVRGSRSSVDELLYILEHSESKSLVIDTPELLHKLAHPLSDSMLKFIVILWGEKPAHLNVPVFTYEEFITVGQTSRSTRNLTSQTFEHIQPQDIATVVYTSGTTGKPKGVTLTHANILHQVKYLVQSVQPDPGDRFLSILPPWHMYERSAEYFIFTRGIEQVYTNVKSLREDFQAYPAQYFVSVPLVFETLYSGVQKQILKASKLRKAIVFGLIWISSHYMNFKRIYKGRDLSLARKDPNAAQCFLAGLLAAFFFPLHFIGDKVVYSKIRRAVGIEKSGISGGGSLPSHVDKFFEIIGITLLNGYGLTEASPVVAARALPDNVLGTVGRPLPSTEVKIVQPETKEELKRGLKGIVMVRGPQVMKAYYKNPEATSKAIDSEGWLDTGDLGWLVPDWQTGPARKCGGMLVLEGRAKDTIVLLTGENVEPAELEEVALQSGLIQQMMIVGQDQRRLGALIVTNKEETDKMDIQQVRKAVREELNKHMVGCAFQVGPFHLVEEPFTLENGLLTPTMKLRRDVILARYQEQVNALFDS